MPDNVSYFVSLNCPPNGAASGTYNRPAIVQFHGTAYHGTDPGSLDGWAVVDRNRPPGQGNTFRPTRSELIASNHSVEEIRRFVEADSVGYLSIGSLRKAVADDEKHEYCYACYTGDYPTELVNIEELIAARQKRK
jgi:hypothetical protein